MKLSLDLAIAQPQVCAGHILPGQMVGAGEAPAALITYNGIVELL